MPGRNNSLHDSTSIVVEYDTIVARLIAFSKHVLFPFFAECSLKKKKKIVKKLV